MPSSNGDSPDSQGSIGPKKRRLPGACDICKRKKIRCDSGQMPGNRCTNCINAGLECTHVELTKNLGSAKGYVENLEHRLEKMEKLLNKLLPGVDINQDSDSDPEIDIETLQATNSTLTRNDDDEDATNNMMLHMKKLELHPPQHRFFGKSSSFYLIRTALHHKKQFTGQDSDDTDRRPFVTTKRHEYWGLRPFQELLVKEEPPNYQFPESDLMFSLIDLYFEHSNSYLPLLHQPTFMNDIARGLHHENPMFGGALLMVCAIGARYSMDPRVFEESDIPASAGWKWYVQVKTIRSYMLSRPTLYELQLYALSAWYAQSTNIGQHSWVEVGIGMRLLQDVGAHRRKSSPTPNAQYELWKRVFWVLLTLDRSSAAFKGRPCSIVQEDFDLDYPIDCDDEHWDLPDPDKTFKQPEGKPSKLSFFICLLKLMDLYAYTMRRIYPVSPTPDLSGQSTRPSEQQVIIELDSALNQWLDSVPGHLKWSTDIEDNIFFSQSAFLYANYYQLQIFIHKPFIPTPKVAISSPFPSLAICTTAARSCARVAGAWKKRQLGREVEISAPLMMISVFASGVILLLSSWNGFRSGAMGNANSDMNDVQTCMDCLKYAESRWTSFGRLWDLLNELASAGNYMAQSRSSQRNKRSRDAEDAENAWQAGSDSVYSNDRVIAGNRRISNASNVHSVETTHPTFDATWQGAAAPFVPPDFSTFNFSPQYPATSFDANPSYHPTELDTALRSQFGTTLDASLFNGMAAPPNGTPQSWPVGNFFEMSTMTDMSLFGKAGEISSGAPTDGNMDYDTMLWSSPPTLFGSLEDWGTFMSNLAQNWDPSTASSQA